MIMPRWLRIAIRGLLLPVSTGAEVPSAFDATGELQPVVLTGAQIVALLGTPVAEIWGYRDDAGTGAFVQIPLQIDERAPYDLTQNIPGGPLDPVYELTYDWLGVEDDLLDADDEIALMARDAGDRAPDTTVWVPEADDVRIELHIDDPLGSGSGNVYLINDRRR